MKIQVAEDKQKHIVAGAGIATFFGFLVHPLLGIILAFVAGWGKEEYDKHHPDKHTYDKKDMYATWLGGLVATLFVSLIFLMRGWN